MTINKLVVKILTVISSKEMALKQLSQQYR